MKVSANPSEKLLKALNWLSAHDHLCLIYETFEEQISAVIPFIRIGLERGEKCIYIADENDANVILGAMENEGIDVGELQKTGALSVLTARDAYLKEGDFDPDRMIKLLAGSAAAAKKEGYAALRVTGEMTWALGGAPGAERLIEYEAKLNFFFPDNDVLAICQYNRNKFHKDVILNILLTHPLVIYGGEVLSNSYFVPPEQFLKSPHEGQEIEWLLDIMKFQQQTHARYKNLFENSPDGIVVLDCETTLPIEFNNKACQQLGYARDEFFKLRVSDYEVIESPEQVAAHAERILREGRDTFETKHRTKTGEIRNMQVIARKLSMDGRESLHCIYRDITERKSAQEGIRKSEEKYRLLFENMINGFGFHRAVFDESGKPIDYIFLEVNKAFERLTGLKREDVIGRGVTEVLPGIENDPADWIGVLGKVAREGGEAKMEQYSAPLKRWYHVYAYSPKKDYFAAIFEDFTDRKLAGNALMESENKFRALAEKSLVGVYVVQDGVFRYVNPKLAEIFGYAPEELTEKMGPKELVTPEDWPIVEENLRKRIEDGVESISYSFRGKTKLGDTIHVEVFGSRTEFHGQLAVMGTLLDITERRRAEQERELYAAELERSNRDLQQFAYVASHDLQEPLRMVASYLQLLEKRYIDKLDEDAVEFIGFAVDGANRMKEMIEALLTYSRVETKGRPFELADLNALAKKVLSNLHVAIEESGAAVTFGKLPALEVDEIQIAQLFQNLISNAIKFRKAPPVVHVSAKQGNGEWVFSVKDNGIGIDEKHLERIFIIFQRLHGRDEYQGSGIGLSLCKRIVERHGGRIWAESSPGEGSTFYFSLPKERGEHD